MTGTPLYVGPEQKQLLRQLRELAEANPVDMRTLIEAIKTPEGKSRHMDQMTAQSVDIPMDYVVTLSIEDGHPCGRARHMSMSVNKMGRIPNEHGVWMIAVELGFWGPSVHACDAVYLEDLTQGKAVNIVQRFDPPHRGLM